MRWERSSARKDQTAIDWIIGRGLRCLAAGIRDNNASDHPGPAGGTGMKTVPEQIRHGHLGKLSSKAVCRLVGGAMDLAAGRFPPLVRIETTNACNSKCTICRHCDIQRPIRQMDQSLFTQIVDECVAWGCREIHLHNFGEPLLDNRLEDRVRYAKRQGIATVKIFSNGSLLSEPQPAA